MKYSIFSSSGIYFRHITQPSNPTLKELAPALQNRSFHHHIAQKSLSCADTPHSHIQSFAHGLDQGKARGFHPAAQSPPLAFFPPQKTPTLKQQDFVNTLSPVHSPPTAQSCLSTSQGAFFHQAAIATVHPQEVAALQLQKISLPNATYSREDITSLPAHTSPEITFNQNQHLLICQEELP